MKINTINLHPKLSAIRFGNQPRNRETPFQKEREIRELSSVYYSPFLAAINPQEYLDSIRYENAQREYYTPETGTYISDNKEGIKKLEFLDDLTRTEKLGLVKAFCEETGFPNFAEIKAKAESEITTNIHQLAKDNNFKVCFIGYDKNCSLGRGLALPGSDCDALFMIIDPKENKDFWFAGAMRWQFKDHINQRLLSTPMGGLPEVLSTEYIEQGLSLADEAFRKADFKKKDLKRFEANLADSTNDFVKSAEFNIRLAEQLPNDEELRTQYYKTAMLVELMRDGVVLEDNFSDDFKRKIKQSPLYKYSNLIKQQGLSNSKKQKYIERERLAEDFRFMDIDEKYSIVKDIIHTSFHTGNIQNKKYFMNTSSSGANEMGNILEMYDKLLHTPMKI